MYFPKMVTAIFQIPQAFLKSCHSPSGDGVYSFSRIETMEITQKDLRDAGIKHEMASIWLFLSREACPQNTTTKLQGKAQTIWRRPALVFRQTSQPSFQLTTSMGQLSEGVFRQSRVPTLLAIQGHQSHKLSPPSCPNC